MRRMLTTLSILVLLAAGCAKNAATPTETDRLRHGFLYGRMTGIPQAEFQAVPEADRRRLAYYGSTFTEEADGTVTWLFPMPDRRVALVFDSTMVVSPAADAGFELPPSKASAACAVPRLLIDGQVPVKPPPLAIESFPDGSLRFEWPFRFEEAGCVHHRPKGAPAIEGSCTNCAACNDNNGLWSFAGCRTARWMGFPGSDCSVAWPLFGLCSYPGDAYCGVFRNCSPLIRHPKCWHKG
ncbi:MAG: hypothetical protein HYZ09_02900 [Candidatus Kerfeldbacteria bacterium]|nr:hypothetical protein [Candidatus Kerfeldbacteria bacterium]